MLRQISVLLCLAMPVYAQDTTPQNYATLHDYLDDRSTPERLISSFYNAINRNEYLRAWSYFRDDAAPEYDTFRDGYADTASVRLRTGEVTSEGAAGSIHSLVPVVIEATGTGGETTVFAGCYKLTQVQPAAQETPPFRPIQIDGGDLTSTDAAFDAAVAACD